MARSYSRLSLEDRHRDEIARILSRLGFSFLGIVIIAAWLGTALPPVLLLALGLAPAYYIAKLADTIFSTLLIERERRREEKSRGGQPVIGIPPDRSAFATAMKENRKQGRSIINKYLVGFEVDTGKPLWVSDDEMCSHGCVFAKTGVGKTLWLESLMFQQMLRGRASGCTFIDAKRDTSTLAHVIFMALVTGRIEDLLVIDPLEPVHSYNFVLTHQRPDVKARKVLRAGLPPIADQSSAKHYDRLAADSVYRIVRAIESLKCSWSIRDVAVALSAFNLAYPQLRALLSEIGARQALVELGHMAASYRSGRGNLDSQRITDNLRGIASELFSIAAGEPGQVFCNSYTDLNLSEAIMRGKIIYFMLPRLEEAEGAARMVKVFREDLEVSIGEITSSRQHNLEDPHLIIIDEGSSTFGPTWANLFELARKGRFSLLFGAQSTGGLTDHSLGLSEAFYARVMANVNLKVMMRVGDNRTARELTEWIGKIRTTKRAVSSGISAQMSSGVLPAAIVDTRRRHSGGESFTMNVSEHTEDLVSTEELKHEMSSEKGLAWFDLGDGKPVKGRAFWVDVDLPGTWEGREFLVQFERHENDEVGLSGWVDQQILAMEEKASAANAQPRTSRKKKPVEKAQPLKSEQNEKKVDAVFKVKPDQRRKSANAIYLQHGDKQPRWKR
jgi:hypothetical protein